MINKILEKQAVVITIVALFVVASYLIRMLPDPVRDYLPFPFIV